MSRKQTSTREGQMKRALDSPTELNEKVARLCGWRKTHCTGGLACGIPPSVTCCDSDDHQQPVPDYCNDLNACHEFRRHLKPEQCKAYILNLGKVVAARAGERGDWRDSFTFAFANAEDHCHAFVATMEAPSDVKGPKSADASSVSREAEKEKDLEET